MLLSKKKYATRAATVLPINTAKDTYVKDWIKPSFDGEVNPEQEAGMSCRIENMGRRGGKIESSS